MKTLIGILLIAGSLSAQYSPSASGSTTAAAEINSKPTITTGAGAPSSGCTAFKDVYYSTAGSGYICTATNTWTALPYAPTTSGSAVLKGNGSGGTAAAVAANIVALFSACSGSQYLGADGACHSTGSGGCTASGGAGTVQGSDGSGGCQATSITDNGTTVSTTEPLIAPSLTVGSGPAVTGSGVIGLKENTGAACASAADCLIADSGSHRLHIYNNGTSDAGAVLGADTTDTLTHKTLDTAGTGNSLAIAGVAVTANSGTGAVCRATNCVMVTPALGTPASGVGTNLTGIPFGSGVTARPWRCTVLTGDPGAASPVLADDNDSPVACGNTTGVDVIITAVSAWSNAGTPTVTPILTGGSGTSVLTGALTAGAASWAAGTVNGTVTLHSFSANGSTCSATPCSIDSNITAAGGTAKYLVVQIVGVY